MDAISLSFHKGVAKEKEPKAAMFAPVRSTMFAFSEQANLHFRLAERGRLWKLLLCRSAKRKTRDYINAFSTVPQVLPPRAAGGKSKGFCQGKPILGVRSCAQDGGGLPRQKAPAALKKPPGSGVPRGVPLVPFLATSWGMPRSSISHPPRVVRRTTKERKQ